MKILDFTYDLEIYHQPYINPTSSIHYRTFTFLYRIVSSLCLIRIELKSLSQPSPTPYVLSANRFDPVLVTLGGGPI